MANRKVAGSLAFALGVGVTTFGVGTPQAGAWVGGPCRFPAGAGTLRLLSVNSTGATDAASSDRAWGAVAATDAWDTTNAPNLVWNATTFDGTIVIDINGPSTHHGTALWNCDSAGNYPSTTGWVALSRHQTRPLSTWQHVTAHENGHILALAHNGSSMTNIMGSVWSGDCSSCRTTPSADDVNGMNNFYK